VLLPLLPTTKDMIGMIDFLLDARSATLAEIEARFAYLRREKIALSLLWMAKFGVVCIAG
jgi:hypothetical protein